MLRLSTLVLAAGACLLAGCGLAETGAAAGAAGVSAAEQAEEARKVTDKVKADLDAAQRTAAEARQAAEAASE